MRAKRENREDYRGLAAIKAMAMAAVLTAMVIVAGIWMKFGPLSDNLSAEGQQSADQESILVLDKLTGEDGGVGLANGGGQDGGGASNANLPAVTSTPEPTVAPTPSPAPSEQPPEPSPTIVPVEEAAGTGKPGAADNRPGSGERQEQMVALTFDDGPDKRYTPAVLDILKEKGVKATFFLVGSNVEKFPEVVKRIVEEGHELGNHSWGHADLRKLTAEEIADDLRRTNEAIELAAGQKPVTIRAPYGAVSPAVLEALESMKQPLVGWNVDPRDWAGTSAAEMMKTIKHQLKPHSNILMHSFGGRKGDLSQTLDMLPDLIDYLTGKGYSFVYASELDL